jgi:hypothetical protein
MDITKYIIYLEKVLQTKEVNDVIIDKHFKDFVYYAKTLDFVIVKCSYFYNSSKEEEYYTFEGLEDLLDGIITLSSDDAVLEDRRGFVQKLEDCITMHTLIRDMELM